MKMTSWDSEVDGVQRASAIFQDPSRPQLVSESEIQDLFSTKMTLDEYHEEVTKLLVKILAGPDFGFEMACFPSIDHDEIFLKLRLPRDDTTLSQYAAHFGYFMPLSDVAYNGLSLDVQLDSLGREVRAYAQFVPERMDCFQAFRQIDRIRLIRARIDKYFDVQLLLDQNILVEHFPTHHWDSVVEMCDAWANPWRWYQLPERENEDHVRDYFGEEISWIFVWQACYSRALILPACLGGILFFRRYFMTMYAEHILETSFAVLMSIWASIFIRYYERYEAILRQSWGMDRFTPPVIMRSEYRPELESSKMVWLWTSVGDLLAFSMLCIDVIGMNFIQRFRQSRLESDEANQWFWTKVAALLISFQICTIDFMWLKISRLLVGRENHRTQQKWDASMVRKIFVVRIFNNFYPFLYVGFLKQYTHEGCPKTKAGCLEELELYLFVYFGFLISSSLLRDLYLIFIARMQVYHELRKQQSHDKHYNYLQIQAKALPNDNTIRMDDWTDSVMAFAFMLSFSVVMPAIAPVALLTNLLQTRCIAHRNVCLLQRPVPTEAAGIGVWLNLLYIVDVVSVIVACSLACFTMQPMRDMDTKTKYICFVAAQYVIFLSKGFIRGKYSKTPSEVVDLRLSCEDMIRRSFVDFQSHPVVATTVTEELPRVGPRAFVPPPDHIPQTPHTPARMVAEALCHMHGSLIKKTQSLDSPRTLSKDSACDKSP